jgi:hypothetical protein
MSSLQAARQDWAAGPFAPGSRVKNYALAHYGWSGVSALVDAPGSPDLTRYFIRAIMEICHGQERPRSLAREARKPCQ